VVVVVITSDEKGCSAGDNDKMSDYLQHQNLKLSTVTRAMFSSSGTKRATRVQAANICQPKITLGSSNTFRQRKWQTLQTHCASVHQEEKLVAALLKVAGVTVGLVESNDSPPTGL